MKFIAGFLLGIAVMVAGYAAAAQISSWVRVSCNSDGTMNIDTVPK
jgi:hypothetical protein